MSTLGADILRWWLGGRVLMPLMLLVALALYTLLAERALRLFGSTMRVPPATARLLPRDARGESEPFLAGVILSRSLTTALPLLGLLGTVTGMVDTFGTLGLSGLHGQDMAAQSSAGISVALTTTQYGMALAIPAVALDWLLGRRAEKLVRERGDDLRQLIAGGKGTGARS